MTTVRAQTRQLRTARFAEPEVVVVLRSALQTVHVDPVSDRTLHCQATDRRSTRVSSTKALLRPHVIRTRQNRVHVTPSAKTARQCQRDLGRQSSRAGMSVRKALPHASVCGTSMPPEYSQK